MKNTFSIKPISWKCQTQMLKKPIALSKVISEPSHTAHTAHTHVKSRRRYIIMNLYGRTAIETPIKKKLVVSVFYLFGAHCKRFSSLWRTWFRCVSTSASSRAYLRLLSSRINENLVRSMLRIQSKVYSCSKSEYILCPERAERDKNGSEWWCGWWCRWCE